MSVLPTSSAANSLAGLNSISVSGLASGLNTNQIIQGLLALDQQQIQNLTNQENQVSARQTAFKQIESRLLTLQNSLGTLASPRNNVFATHTATPSISGILTATASSSAVGANYTLQVTSLAQAEQIASQGFASATSTITHGPFQIGLASGPAANITIDSSNDTLQGLANAINQAAVGVSASIISDGSANQPFRLLLSSTKTGTSNSIAISNGLDADNNGAVQPLFQDMVQQAADASVTIGTGPGAITVTNASNQINNLIPGVTLNLQAKSTSPFTLTVANDTGQASQAIGNFVQAYNDLMSNIDQQTSFDSASGKAGPLLGDFRVTVIQDRVRSIVQNTVAGTNPLMSQMGALGITQADDGSLVLDQNRLNNVLSGSVSGIALDDVRKFFAFTGSSTNPAVQFLTGSDKTVASTTPYQVQVTQAASQATLTAAGTLAASTKIDATNDTFSIHIDGTFSGPITLAHNDAYTPQELAQAVQAAINGSASLAGRSVTVGLLNSNQLVITSANYGTASKVALGTGTALGDLGLSGSSPAQGQDVSGYFLVNNLVEGADGRGQILAGRTDNAHTAGLQIRVALTPDQITATPEAELTLSRGMASQLSTALSGLLDPVTGRLASIDQAFQDQLTDLQNEVTRQNQLMAAKQQNLAQQFTIMEQTIAQLQSTSSFLSTQFSTLLGGNSQQQSQQKGILNG